MTSSESQPRTRAGLDVMRKIDGNTVGPDDEEIYLDDILAVESEAWEQGRADFRRAVNKAAASFQENGEAEAAQDSRPVDVERDGPDHPYPHYGYFCAERDCPGYVNRPANRPAILRAVADGLALPSPAPEPPPVVQEPPWREPDTAPHTSWCRLRLTHQGRCSIVPSWRAAQPAPDSEAIRHALEYINKALDKASYGDSVQGDLLEAHATLDDLLQARESGGEP